MTCPRRHSLVSLKPRLSALTGLTPKADTQDPPTHTHTQAGLWDTIHAEPGAESQARILLPMQHWTVTWRSE